MAINVKPLGDRVLVQPIEEQETKKGGIIIPDTAKEKPQEGKVVALGTGKIDDNGKKVELPVKKILMGIPIAKAANPDSLRNPDTLQPFVELAAA